jgi:pyruvate,orthophosphate dikinase
MFFEPDRIVAIRRMILAEDEVSREAALSAILPEQRHDFIDLFEIMRGKPVTIRLLDPPLHEFLPHSPHEISELAHSLNLPVATVEARVQSLSETNPMLGFRGCRLGVAYPEITRMQARAILEAAAEVERKTGQAPVPEIMIPLVTGGDEFKEMKRIVDDVASDIAAAGQKVRYSVGTMIELPRAVLKAGEIAETAEFFSFGTNDLTQTCFGLSRDDAAPFLGHYLRKGLIDGDPFATLDVGGVGELMEIGIERGRTVNPNLKIGICGEHGGDPASIAYCDKVGLSYVSCSPYRVPIARLAAAQATIINQRQSALQSH